MTTTKKNGRYWGRYYRRYYRRYKTIDQQNSFQRVKLDFCFNLMYPGQSVSQPYMYKPDGSVLVSTGLLDMGTIIDNYSLTSSIMQTFTAIKVYGINFFIQRSNTGSYPHPIGLVCIAGDTGLPTTYSETMDCPKSIMLCSGQTVPVNVFKRFQTNWCNFGSSDLRNVLTVLAAIPIKEAAQSANYAVKCTIYAYVRNINV